MADPTSTIHSILYLTFGTFPSTAAHAVNIIKMSEAIAKSGYEFTLAANARGIKREIFDFYSVREPFEIKRIKLLPIRFVGRVLFLTKAYFFARKKDPDLLYVRDVFNASLAVTLGRPFIFEIHETWNSHFRKILFKRVLSSKHLLLIVLISEKLKESLMSEFGDLLGNKKWLIAHDGIDLQVFDVRIDKKEIRNTLELPQKAFIAGYTGSLFKGRGAEVILKLGSALEDVVFVVVGGEGKYLSAIHKKVKERNLRNVIVKGFVPHKTIPSYLAAFDLLLMPYQIQVLHRQRKHDTAFYMSPLKMFEYMASGKPIISSDIGVLKEVLNHLDNALLVHPEKIEEWIKAIDHVKKDSALADQLGKKAKEDVKRYSWEERSRFILESLQKA